MWIAEDSCPEYMVKAEECLRAEEDRVQHYLHISTKPKLLEQARPGHLLEVDCLRLLITGHQQRLRLQCNDHFCMMSFSLTAVEQMMPGACVWA